MRRWIVVLGEVALTVLCVVLAVASWRNGLITTTFAPARDVPGFVATRYRAPWLVLAAFLMTVGGVIAIDVVARTVHTTSAVRSRRH